MKKTATADALALELLQKQAATTKAAAAAAAELAKLSIKCLKAERSAQVARASAQPSTSGCSTASSSGGGKSTTASSKKSSTSKLSALADRFEAAVCSRHTFLPETRGDAAALKRAVKGCSKFPLAVLKSMTNDMVGTKDDMLAVLFKGL